MNDMVCPITNGLPKVRETPLDPPAIFGQLRAEQPIAPMTFPDGARGWVVTGYEQARTILADSRFSSKASTKHLAFASDLATDFDLEKDMPPAQFEHMD